MVEARLSSVTLAAILTDLTLLIKARWRLLLAVTLINAVFETWIEWTFSPSTQDLWLFLLVPLSVYLSTVITCAALKDVHLVPGHIGKWKTAALIFPAAMLQLAIATLGVVAALVLLVIPGLILFVRWSPALPILVAEKKGVWASLEKSWQMTAGCWVLIAELACLSVVLFLPTAISVLWYPEESGRALPWIFGDYLFSYAASVLMTLAAVSLYRQLRLEADAAPFAA